MCGGRREITGEWSRFIRVAQVDSVSVSKRDLGVGEEEFERDGIVVGGVFQYGVYVAFSELGIVDAICGWGDVSCWSGKEEGEG